MTVHQDALDPDLGVMPLPPAALEVGIRDHLVIIVHGAPVGQGSKKSVGHGVFIDDNAKRLKPWREAVKAAAAEAMAHMYDGDHTLPLFARGVPVHLGVVFTLARPASHYGSGRNAQTLKASAPVEHIGFPDVDKAQRAVFDALVHAGVVADDRQITKVTEAARVYPGGHRDALPVPGAVIRVRAVPR